MSLSEDILDFMVWNEATSISPKQQKTLRHRKRNAKRNLAEQIGKRCRCACCGKHFRKSHSAQVVCGKNWCNNKINEINYKD